MSAVGAATAVLAWATVLLLFDLWHPAFIAVLAALLLVLFVTAWLDHRAAVAREQITRICNRHEVDHG